MLEVLSHVAPPSLLWCRFQSHTSTSLGYQASLRGYTCISALNVIKTFWGETKEKKTSLLTIPLWQILHRLLPVKELPSGYYVIYSEVNWHFLHYMVQVTLFEKLLEVLGRSTSSVPEHVYHINLRSWGKNKTECCCKKQCKPSTISLHWEYKNFLTFCSVYIDTTASCF